MVKKRDAMKGQGDAVREQPLTVEPRQDGNRRERRLWQKLYGNRKTTTDSPEQP